MFTFQPHAIVIRLAPPDIAEAQVPSLPSWDVIIFGPRHLRHLVIVRGFFGSVAFSLLYSALPLLPVGEFQAILFLNPIVIFLLAYPILGEPVGFIEAAAVCFSFIGALCIVRPSSVFGGAELTRGEAEEKTCGTAFALSGAVLVAIVMITVRYIGKRVQSVVLAFSFHSFSFVFGIILLLLRVQKPVWPTLEDALYLCGIAVTSFFGQIMLNYSYSALPASQASSLNYLQVAFSFLLGWVFLGEAAVPWSIFGSTLIMLSGGLVTYFRDKVKKKVRNKAMALAKGERTHTSGVCQTEEQPIQRTAVIGDTGKSQIDENLAAAVELVTSRAQVDRKIEDSESSRV